MSHPDDDVLVDLALDSSASAEPGVRDHVETCDACSGTVRELRQAAAFASTAGSDAGWLAPAPAVWSRITSDLDGPTAPAGPSATASGQTASRGSTASGPTASDEVSRRPVWRIGWAAGIAAAGIAVGLLAGRAIWLEPTDPTTTVSQVALDTLDTKQPLGRAAVLRTSSGVELEVDTTTRLDAGSGYLEVWLINRDGKRMVSVGVLRGEGAATFPISQVLLDQGYVVVDVSREQFDDKPTHSGESLARGQLPA